MPRVFLTEGTTHSSRRVDQFILTFLPWKVLLLSFLCYRMYVISREFDLEIPKKTRMLIQKNSICGGAVAAILPKKMSSDKHILGCKHSCIVHVEKSLFVCTSVPRFPTGYHHVFNVCCLKWWWCWQCAHLYRTEQELSELAFFNIFYLLHLQLI